MYTSALDIWYTKNTIMRSRVNDAIKTYTMNNEKPNYIVLSKSNFDKFQQELRLLYKSTNTIISTYANLTLIKLNVEDDIILVG